MKHQQQFLLDLENIRMRARCYWLIFYLEEKPSRRLYSLFQRITGFFLDDEGICLIAHDIKQNQINDIQNRLEFYAPKYSDAELVPANLSWRVILGRQPLLLFGEPSQLPWWVRRFRPGVFDIDYRRNYLDGWEWCRLAKYCTKEKVNLRESWHRFRRWIDTLRKQGLRRAYIFGTGPSLEEAIGQDWSDGYRIVCNTIVRDPVLWKHINPHAIVAGDAIYHFGHTDFARTFRRDLVARLKETDTVFIYPSLFHEIVRRDLSQFSDRLIPIPQGGHKKIHVDLSQCFALPGLGNVLRSQLLPLACTLSRDVYLWGFDGRAPDDKLFWSNSPKHSYPELMQQLQEAHPAFFDHLVPEDKPDRYVRQVHGEALENCLQAAENEGWQFVMLHRSWTPTLQKRFEVH